MRIALLIFLIYLSSISAAQTFKQYVKEGDKAFSQGDYYIASVMYTNALKLDKSILKVVYKKADACRLSYDYKQAEKLYKQVFNTNEMQFPLSVFWYGEMLKCQGQYQKAQQFFNRYYTTHKEENDYYTIRAKHEILSCEKAYYMMLDINGTQINRANNIINSVYSELNTFIYNDTTLLFSAYRPESKTDSTKLTSIFFTSKLRSNDWTNVQLFDSVFLETDFNISNLTFSDDYKTVWYSKCPKNNEAIKCMIYSRKWENNKWSDAIVLPEEVNMPNSNTIQPSFAQTKDEKFLMFVSDRAGGMGKLDIWFSKILENGIYDIASNMGNKINSIEDEITPFYSSSDSLLYFSSRWNANFGGFDIFNIKGDFYFWDNLKNMGYPINTCFNELYFNINQKAGKAFLTSNRNGSLSFNNQHCCNDIYYYDLPKDKKKTITKEEKTEIVMKEIKQLIPLTLYFHNDEPNPRTTDTITSISYDESVTNYLKMIDEYKSQYSKGLKGIEKQESINKIDDFFTENIEKNYNDLLHFMHRLEGLLADGENIVITLKGFTSPLNTTEYNQKLAKRRISSLVNLFKTYNNGIFLKYINGNADLKNTLIFKLEAIGEDLAGKNVSDDVNDKRNSVYSPNAASERKIQIIAISVPK